MEHRVLRRLPAVRPPETPLLLLRSFFIKAVTARRFNLAAINALERNYVTAVGWDMYISQSLYAKYYFALRSLNEKHDFRRKYNRFVLNDSKEQPKDANMVELRSNKIRSEWVKALSKSL